MLWRAIAGAALLGALGGCAGYHPGTRAVRYAVDVRLDPASSSLEGRATVEFAREAGTAAKPGRTVVDLDLNPELEVLSVEAAGAQLRSHRRRAPRRGGGKDEVKPARHRFVLDGAPETFRLTLAYGGRLFQDVESGEREGQVHNFSVSAHVGERGIFLDPTGYWYPQMRLPDEAAPEQGLAAYGLVADPVEGFELVAGLEQEPAQDGRLHWESPFPLDGLVLLGGPLERFDRAHGDVELHAVLAPGKAAVAEDILAAAGEYLDRYEPLIGPYPFTEFTVLEAFFSSGFAFPTCTQIVGSQLSEYRQYRRHGYLDHELLHNWWGNGVLVDPRDGNWCEGLASYMGNYYGYVLDGDEEGARKQRRNQSNFLSAIEPAEDLPLGTFGLKDGAGRGIGYNKGAGVFHMLERKIGPDTLQAGLRRITAERMGRYTSWGDLQRAFEQESGLDLEPFFRQWVRGAGAPLLELRDARPEPGEDGVAVTIAQEGTAFELDVPLRLHYADGGSEDVVVTIAEPLAEVSVPCDRGRVGSVELDPDYHLFRKLAPEETMPTSSLTRSAERLLIVTPGEPLFEGYRHLVDSYSRDVRGEDADEKKKKGEVEIHTVETLREERLEGSAVLIVGDAVRDEKVSRFLARTASPVEWIDGGFRVGGQSYTEPGQAVFFTVHHPDRPDLGVTVYYGNSAEALSNVRVLGFYPNSLLVFETPLGGDASAEAAGGMPRARVLDRIDFEFHDRIELDADPGGATAR